MTANSNWTRRNGSNYRRLCARPGCGAPAAATLRFQPTQREAWLVDLEDDGARTEGDLCARHAAGLVLPRGWQLHNSLTSARSETSEPAPAAPKPRRTSVARAARRRRSQTNATALPGLSSVEEVAPVRKLRVAPEPRRAPAPRPEVAPEVAPEVESKVEAPAVAPVTVAEPAPLVAPASPAESEALAETLDAQTPLLRRAFSNVFLPEGE